MATDARQSDDYARMAQALRLARRGLYSTDPNPRVGCVIVNGGQVVGEGWHQRAGEPHAEVFALRAAGAQAQGATAYVTLEPCSHHGRTPPCAEALVAAGVARVVAAGTDPNPQVSGAGLARLKAAGIEVHTGVLADRAEALNPGFFKRMRSGRPFVRVKMATSLDGRTALANGTSQWITGAQARQDVQFLRARASAVLTGIDTVLADDPSLNVRLSAQDLGIDGPVRQPLRIVLDSRGRLPSDAALFNTPGPVWVATTEAGAERLRGHRLEQILVCQESDGRVDLADLLRQLAQRELNEIHVEAGARLAGAFLQAGLVDELIVYLAPLLLGSTARGAFELGELTQMSDRLDLAISDIRAVGADWRLTAQPKANA